jgi:hypothetical protein
VEDNPNSKGIAVNATYNHELVKRMIDEAVKAEREVVANWIMDMGFATGHGDSIVDLLDQLEWQIAEKEREACAKIADEWAVGWPHPSQSIAERIRARGQA